MTAITLIALKNPQNAPAPNSSIWAATLGISADCALKARRTVTGGRLSANAGSPAKISQRVSVASTIVIESKIRVFQHNRREADIADRGHGRRQSADCCPLGRRQETGEAKALPVSLEARTPPRREMD